MEFKSKKRYFSYPKIWKTVAPAGQFTIFSLFSISRVLFNTSGLSHNRFDSLSSRAHEILETISSMFSKILDEKRFIPLLSLTIYICSS